MRPAVVFCLLIGVLALGLRAPDAGAQTSALSALSTAELEARAEAGNTAAQTALGQRYHEGTDVIQSFSRAAEWFARAAAAGDAEAQNHLGRYYYTGLGVEADPATALRLLRAAADRGKPRHLFDLATALEETSENEAQLSEAAALYARAAEAGHEDAAVSLGVMYQNGLGVAQDYARAKALYEGPADAGNARAQNNLGLLYVRGTGVLQDYARAAELFAAAAEQGFPAALTNLGVMYENGFGVALDEERARELYRLGSAGRPEAETAFVYDQRLAPPPSEQAAIDRLGAAARAGDPVAEFQMAWLLIHLAEPAAADWRNAALLLRRGAEKGHAAAMVNLALLHRQGQGVPQDYVLAQMWLTLAAIADPGLDSALSDALQRRMTPGQINEAQALAEARSNG